MILGVFQRRSRSNVADTFFAELTGDNDADDAPANAPGSVLSCDPGNECMHQVYSGTDMFSGILSIPSLH